MTLDRDRACVRITIARNGPVNLSVEEAEASAAHPGHPKPPKLKTSFYQPPDEAGRTRAVFMATRAWERHSSFSAFVCNALRAEAERLEQKYNQGAPWPSVDVGDLPKGAPFGG